MTTKSDEPSRVHTFRGALWTKDHARTGASSDRSRGFGGARRKGSVCGISEVCKTCKYINQDYASSLNEKYQKGLDLLGKEYGLLNGVKTCDPSPSPRNLEYRTHAKLAVRPFPEERRRRSFEQDTRFAIGLFEPESHKIIDLNFCPLHRRSIDRLVKDLRVHLEESSINPYDESDLSGDLRYLSIRASHLTEELMLTFVVTNETKRLEYKNIAMRLRQQGHQVSSVYLNINDQSTNAIFGKDSKRILGSDRLREELCGLGFEIGPSSFFQVNPWQASNIYRRIQQIAGTEANQSVAWDLYCGVGMISMLLSQSGFRTLGIEENPQAIRDAQRNVVRNDLPNQPSFIAGRVEDLVDDLPGWAKSPKLIVVNPSRRGIAAPVRQALCSLLKQHPDCKLVYLSCEVTSLARDLQDLTKSGRTIRQVEGYDMFPYTDKMEWLTVLT